MTDRRRSWFARLAAYMIVAAAGPGALLGCEEGVDPFIESERYFSLFGTLDMNADTQWVRIVPIDRDILVEPGDTIDARVSMTDLVTSAQTVWTDSVFTFADGSRGHVFFAPVRVQPDHTYRLEVSRSDGSTSTAETTVPPLPAASVGEVERVIFSNGAVEITIPITWNGVERPPTEVQTWYRFGTTARSNFEDLRIDYPTADGSTDAGWQIVARLSSDRQTIVEQIIPENFLFLGMGMRIVVLDDQFVPPGGVFDPDVLSQPGALSNVDNGFGFVGSIGRFEVQWVVDGQTAADLGYTVPKR
ncbi:MAG: hypothetical protein R3282_01005 [Rhodothermales bacterium]|nr:hypothetical protein [Rhodothermales bacterium]